DVLGHASTRIGVPIVVAAHAGSGCIRRSPGGAPNPGASSDAQFGRAANARYFATAQITVQIPHVVLQVFEGLALGLIVRVIIEIPEPIRSILPIDVPGG